MIDLATFKSPKVRKAYEYWLSKCAAGHLPSRADIRPQELRGLLAYVFLIDVAHAPLRFTFRLVGTEITRWAGGEYTGFTFSEREGPPSWKAVFADYRNVVDTRLPYVSERSAPWVSKEFYHFERMVAPLSPDGKTVDMLFGALQVLKTEPGTL